MTNVEILERRGQLGDVRQRCGAKDKDDPSVDGKINEMSAMSVARAWTGWHIGDPNWASDIIDLYEAIKGGDKGLY